MSTNRLPRIIPVQPPYDANIAEGFNRIMPPGMEPLKLFRTMAISPRVFQRMFAGALLDKGSIALRDREIVILRTCFRCGSEYEWGVHVALFSKKAALSEADIACTRSAEPQQHEVNARDAVLIELVDELHDNAMVSDQLWTALTSHYSAEQILELIAVIGYYHTISFMTNAAQVELENFAPRFDAHVATPC